MSFFLKQMSCTLYKKMGYMVVTAHYIDASWNLKSQILRYVKKFELFLYYC